MAGRLIKLPVQGGDAKSSGDGLEWMPLYMTRRWSVRRVEIADPPPAALRKSFLERPILSGGFFVPAPAASWTPRVKVPALKTYDPLAEADAVMTAVMQIKNPYDSQDVLGFVNAWGQLGVGYNPDATGVVGQFDSVHLTMLELGKIQRLVRYLRAVQRSDWSSQDLPPLEEAAMRGPGLTSISDPRRVYWSAFAWDLDGGLQEIHQVHVYNEKVGGLAPVLNARRLVDVLYLTLADWATSAAKLRSCPRCSAVFLPGRTDKRYCSTRCTGAAGVARWRAKKRRPGKRGAAPRKR